MTTDLSSLIERIEKSERPRFFLDSEIFKAIYGHDASGNLPPGYTVQIDRALTLFPEGVTGWSLNNDGPQSEALIFRDGDGVIGRGNAATPALAICAAALKARNPSQ